MCQVLFGVIAQNVSVGRALPGRQETEVAIQMERRFLGLGTRSDESSEQMHAEVDGAAVARVFNLRDVLELINDRLDEGALAEQQPVGEVHESIAHVLAQFGDQVESVGD